MNTEAKQITRQRMWIAVALLVLGVYAIFGVLDARSAQTRLNQARTDLADVAGKLDDIDRLRQAPRVAALQAELPGEITDRIAEALAAAGLQSSYKSVDPQDPQRIQRTDFELRSTSIDLNAATLVEIIEFCDALRDEDTGAVVRDLTLTEPQNGADSGDQEKWESQLILTQMIYSPKSQ